MSKWPHDSTMSIDGVNYEIPVRLVDGRFYTSWECMKCHEISGSYFRRNSADDAIEFARIHLTGHHNSVHRRQ